MSLPVSVCVEKVFDDDPFVDRIDRAAAAGADAVEFWGWRDKDLDAVADRAAEYDLDVAGMVAGAGSLVDPHRTDQAIADFESAIAEADAIDCPTLIVTTGLAEDAFSREEQREALVSALAGAAPAAEDAGVTLAVEPLNVAVDHEGYFLAESAEAFEIAAAANSEAVTVLFDVYHQQITEGDVTRGLTENVADVGHVHVADNPGRHEPGTGELNYANILDALDETDYDGYVGCEFDPVGDAEAAVEHVVELAD
ncbi:MAG: TIM barrel protein [Halobacteriaceae archaeon]